VALVSIPAAVSAWALLPPARRSLAIGLAALAVGFAAGGAPAESKDSRVPRQIRHRERRAVLLEAGDKLLSLYAIAEPFPLCRQVVGSGVAAGGADEARPDDAGQGLDVGEGLCAGGQ
jgi:hypothetical protein